MDLEHLFSTEGPFAKAFPGYKLRQSQLEMAQAVQVAIEEKGQLIAEAGTGTGKTFAYLVPAMKAGSCARKTLLICTR